MNILLISHFFPPLNTMASQRTYSFARYLTDLGCHVVVLTTAKKALGPTADLSLSMDLEGIEIHEIDPLPPFFPPILAIPHNSTVVGGSGRSLLSFLREKILGKSVDALELWVPKAFSFALTLCRARTFDVILSSYGPAACHYLGCLLKRRFPQSIWAADYRDLWGHCHLSQGSFPFTQLTRKLERWTMKDVDLFLTVSEPFRDQLSRIFKKPAFVVENGFFPEDENHSFEKRPLVPGKTVFSYTGYLYGQKRDPVPLFKALQELVQDDRLDPGKIELRFYGSNSFILGSEIESMGLQRSIFTFGKIPRRDAIEVQRRSQGLIFLEWSDPTAEGVMTGKIFEYLVSGVPIIGVGVAPGSLIGELIQKSQTGFVCGNRKELMKEALLKVVAGFTQDPYWPEIQGFRRDRIARKLLATLCEALQAGGALPSGASCLTGGVESGEDSAENSRKPNVSG